MSSTWGNHIKISIWGESHSESIGVVVDGLPSGEQIDWDELLFFMERRRSQGGALDTPRKESDLPQIQSGLLNHITCGTPICALIPNENTRSKDYSLFSQVARPSHADYTGALRYNGYNDIRGGGHFSGRLTAPLVFAGGLARQILHRRGISIAAHIAQIGTIWDDPFTTENLTPQQIDALNHSFFPVLNAQAGEQMQARIAQVRSQKDSIGGMIQCAVLGIPGGYGDPLFDSVESLLSSLLFSIPAVKGVSFGDGFSLCSMVGSEANDPFSIRDGKVVTNTNRNGGILGGITTGMPVVFQCAFKPTASIAKEQKTVNFVTKEETTLAITGRHDPCIVRRAVPVVESAAALAVLDLLLSSDRGWNIR